MHVSPSQIEKFGPLAPPGEPPVGCRRKWAYSRIRPRGSPNRWAAFGIEAHRQLELWLRDRKPPDTDRPEGIAALEALPILPVPGRDPMLIEHEVRADFFGEDYLFKIDLISGYNGDRVVVWDHKFVGDLSRRKTVDQLRWDPQWIVYAAWAGEAFGVSEVVGVWDYVRRRPPKVAPIAIVESTKCVMARFQEQHDQVVVPLSRLRGVPPEEIPRNLDECYRYGPRNPCEFIEDCHQLVTPAELAEERLRNV